MGEPHPSPLIENKQFGTEDERLLQPQNFPALAPKGLEEILQRWRELHRRWHGRTHLLKLLTLVNQTELAPADQEMLNYVALFHDAIYQPLSATNEEDSARLAEKYLIGYGRQDEVVRAILATKHHRIEEASKGRLEEEKLIGLFNAWDCAILSETSWEELLSYEDGIAFEYREVDRDVYRRERSRFLRGAAKDYDNPLLERLANEVARG